MQIDRDNRAFDAREHDPAVNPRTDGWCCQVSAAPLTSAGNRETPIDGVSHSRVLRCRT
jgi:hypothetical protein